MSKRDTSSPEYRSALSSSLRWDAERKEPYLQLPSFPDLRLTLFREGIVDDLVSPFNSPRLHLISFKRPHCSTTPWSEYAFTAYPTRTSPPFFPTDAEERCRLSMPRSFVEEWFERDYPIHQNILISFLAHNPDLPSLADTSPIPPTSDCLLEMPFKSLRSQSTGKVVGDINLVPHSYHFYPVQLTPEQVRARPPAEQMWDFGYSLDPAYHGKGVTSEIVGCVIEGWIRPWMGIGIVGAVNFRFGFGGGGG